MRPAHYDAVIFDLDGVVTDTANVHAAAWKLLFDEVLRITAASQGEPFAPFDLGCDYHAYVDGRPRYEGVQSFLRSRGIALDFGDPGDPPDASTVCGLGNRKDATFAELLSQQGVRVFHSTITLLRALQSAGVRRAIASSSKNCRHVLEIAGIEGLFDVRVDGLVLAELGLQGKPHPDLFLRCAELLDVAPPRTVVVEDALSGVAAARAGGFGLVIGLDRAGQGEALRAHGADVVVEDLDRVDPRQLDGWCRDHSGGMTSASRAADRTTAAG